jgi:hypothetical protein
VHYLTVLSLICIPDFSTMYFCEFRVFFSLFNELIPLHPQSVSLTVFNERDFCIIH